MASNINIWSWNARSLVCHHDQLKELLTRTEPLPDIICIQETFLSSKLSFKVPGYVVERRDRLEKGGGVAICIKEGQPYKVLASPESHEIMLIDVITGSSHIVVANVYIPPGKNSPGSDETYEVLKELGSKHDKILFEEISMHITIYGVAQK